MFDFFHNYTRKRKTGGIIDFFTINNSNVSDSLLLFVIGCTGFTLLFYNLRHTQIHTLSRTLKACEEATDGVKKHTRLFSFTRVF